MDKLETTAEALSEREKSVIWLGWLLSFECIHMPTISVSVLKPNEVEEIREMSSVGWGKSIKFQGFTHS